MIIITHDNGFAVSNEATIFQVDNLADDRKSIKRHKGIKVKHAYNYAGTLERNQEVECVMMTDKNKPCFRGFIDKLGEESLTIIIKDSETSIEKIRKFVKQKI